MHDDEGAPGGAGPADAAGPVFGSGWPPAPIAARMADPALRGFLASAAFDGAWVVTAAPGADGAVPGAGRAEQGRPDHGRGGAGGADGAARGVAAAWMDPGMRRLLGHDARSLPDTPEAWRGAIHPADLDPTLTALHEMFAAPGAPRDLPLRLLRRDGELATVRCRVMALPGGDGPPAAIGVQQDLTGLMRAKTGIQAASALKSAFISDLRHELRTPLNVILGAAELLEQAHSDPMLRRLAASAAAAARQAAEMLEGVGDLARIEAGETMAARSVFDPAALVEEAVSIFAPAAEAAGVTLELSLDGARGPVAGAPGRLRQVLSNLLGNALTHSGAGRIAVRAALHDAPPEPGALLLTIDVSDDGRGMSDALKRVAFERHVQGPERAPSAGGAGRAARPLSGGSGLGLFISRTLCEAHGGTLTVDDTPGGGVTFRISARVRRSPAAGGAARGGAPAD
ncbi:PAS domain-containing sensor histidine kinase [Rhodovulum sp. DZ06]|uniref:PAS domain-containing sensor histidine kinase n=1 Tax=Rhodovulum sp. DZ06 TaxID=3425126 RepID=UPI003D32EB12